MKRLALALLCLAQAAGAQSAGFYRVADSPAQIYPTKAIRIIVPYAPGGPSDIFALAVTGSQRSPLVPELPTIAESGLAGYSVTAWFGLLAPAATPADIVARISAEIQKGFSTPQMKERFSAMGADPVVRVK